MVIEIIVFVLIKIEKSYNINHKNIQTLAIEHIK